VAEDDVETRTLLSWGLRLHGFQVEEVESGTELFEHLTTLLEEGGEMPDLVVSDLRMPGFTGLEILGCVRRAELRVPFILMTAYPDEDAKRGGAAGGAAAFLAKPFEFEALLAAIDRATGGTPDW
jgi:CheY-like chemotaxis protein